MIVDQENVDNNSEITLPQEENVDNRYKPEISIALNLDSQVIQHPLNDDPTFSHNDKKVNYGDLVLIYENRDSIKHFILEKGKIFQNKYGNFKHDDIYGTTYGTKITAVKSQGYITVLDFITNLWERCINRLTQILFNPDISMIMTFLNIRSDSIIYESGTGSGCLSTNMSQVLNEGHLYTFEFNKERQEKLTSTFKLIGLEKKVTVIHRDVIENGFEVELENLEKPEHKFCDGIFIDLPSPELVIEKAKKVLKSGGSFVSFSPCIEQIDKTMRVLKEHDFINPRMFECMYRNYSLSRVVKINVPTFSVKRKYGESIPYEEKEINVSNSRIDMRGHTGFLMFATKL